MSDKNNTLTSASAEKATSSEETTSPSRSRRRTGGSLSSMLLPQLQQRASELGIKGIARMRKGELIAAIKEQQEKQSASSSQVVAQSAENSESATKAVSQESSVSTSRTRPRRRASRPAGAPEQQAAQADTSSAAPAEVEASTSSPLRAEESASRAETSSVSEEKSADPAPTQQERPRRNRSRGRGGARSERTENASSSSASRGSERDSAHESRTAGQGGERGMERNTDRSERSAESREDRGRSRRRNRNRDRDRNNRGRGRFNPSSETISEDDVLIPVAGIIDVLDNYAFVRTSGYLAGPDDVYVSMSQVRKNGLRRGDAVTGAVRQPREGERQAKYNPLVRLDTINGVDVETARKRPEFHKLTPLYPQDRLRLETEPQQYTSRVIDLVMPIGKGQRALIVSPPKAGKTMVMQSIANAITTNNPETHLMVVLVDERPEEVTDMQRSVKGEVIASTFDRPPSDHTTVSELAIERAKRLVELGHDVVVLLDSITRLGRAYNLAAPASGRILSGGVDSTALYPPKKFLGAARNIENGGSLTIIATALVETGSAMDNVIFEEFKGTGNAELKLDRRIADKRVFPAVDVDASGTRKEEILLSGEELAIVWKLRKVLHALDTQQALDLLLEKLRKTKNNAEFLMQISQSTPGGE